MTREAVRILIVVDIERQQVGRIAHPPAIGVFIIGGCTFVAREARATAPCAVLALGIALCERAGGGGVWIPDSALLAYLKALAVSDGSDHALRR